MKHTSEDTQESILTVAEQLYQEKKKTAKNRNLKLRDRRKFDSEVRIKFVKPTRIEEPFDLKRITRYEDIPEEFRL